MGCTSSDGQTMTRNITLDKKKPSVWLVGGGPGCQKGKICQHLIRDYKFKYLSSYDMVQFQQQRGGPDAELILKLFKQKKTMPSNLIVRIIKKAIASCGIRRFLIDGFPNSLEDVTQFDKQLTQKQIDFFGYLNIRISEQKMIQSGIEAYSADKTKSKSRQEVQSNVKLIVKNYISQAEKIRSQYSAKKKYHQINGEEGADKTYQKCKLYLQQLGVHPPKPVRILFSNFQTSENEQILYETIVKKYGLHYHSISSLIEQAESKINTPESQTIKKLQKENKEIPTSLIISLIRKKIQKHDYMGAFMISQFPRSFMDFQQWNKHFGWETEIVTYITLEQSEDKLKKAFEQKISENRTNLTSEQIGKQYKKFRHNQSEMLLQFQSRGKLNIIRGQQQKQRLKQFEKILQSKGIFPRQKITESKIIMVSTLCGNGEACAEAAKKKGAAIINVDQLLQQKIQDNGLYSQLIQSFAKIGKPVPGAVVTKFILQQSKVILIQGFPSNEQHLQTWYEQEGDSAQIILIMAYELNPKYIEQCIRQKIKQKKLSGGEKDAQQLIRQNSNRIYKKINGSNCNHYIINKIDDVHSIRTVFDKFGFK